MTAMKDAPPTLAPKEACPRGCDNGTIYTGYDRFGRPNATEACECRKARRLERELSKVRRQIPPSFQNLSWDRNPTALIPDRPKATLRRYTAGIAKNLTDGNGLWLGGRSGLYKTAAACLITEEARRQSIAAEFWSVPELLMRLARVRHDDAYTEVDHEEEFHETLEKVPLLVLDDLSATKTSPWAIEQLYVIVNRRYNLYLGGGGITIVTTDLDAKSLGRMFSHRTIRRLGDLTTFVSLDPPESAAAA